MAEITKNTDKGRYEITADGELAGFADYRVAEMGNVALTHTEVDDKFRGQGLAGQLVQFALDDIRREGYQVIPECPYVKDWIAEHGDYADLVASDERDVAGVADDMEEVTGVDPSTDPRL